MRTRIALVLAGIALVLVGGHIFEPRWFDQVEGQGVASRLDVLVTSAEDGSTVDLREAYQADWDRAVVIGAYSQGSHGNSLLGFEYFGRDEGLSYSEEANRVLFVRGDDVLADVVVETFTFDDDVVFFTPEQSRFVVARPDGWARLERVRQD